MSSRCSCGTPSSAPGPWARGWPLSGVQGGWGRAAELFEESVDEVARERSAGGQHRDEHQGGLPARGRGHRQDT